MPSSNGTSRELPVMDFDTAAGTDLHSAIGLYFAASGGHSLVSSGSPLPVTATVTPFATTADDNNIAAGATLEYLINLEYVYYGVGGTDWLRLMGAIHDSPAQTASTIQFLHVGGFVTTAELTLAVADGSVQSFNTQGRLRAVLYTTAEDGSIDAGASPLTYESNLNYFYNRDTASPDVWNRWLGGSEDNTWAQGLAMAFVANLGYINNGTTWIRWHGGVDNAAAVASPQGAFAAGVVTDPVDVFVDGDVSLLHFDLSGRLLTTATSTPFATTADDNAIPVGATLEYSIDLEYGWDVVGATDWVRQQLASLVTALSSATVTFGLATTGTLRVWDGSTTLDVVYGARDNAAFTGTPTGGLNAFYAVTSATTTYTAGDSVIQSARLDTVARTSSFIAGAAHPDTYALTMAWDPVLLQWLKLVVDAVTAGLWVHVVGGTVAVTQSTSPWVVAGDETWASPFSTAGTDWDKVISSLFAYNGTDLLTLTTANFGTALPGTVNPLVVGGPVDTADTAEADNDAMYLRFTDIGSAIAEVRSLAPNAVDSTTTNLAATTGLFTGATLTQSFYSSTRARSLMAFWVYYEGATATITVFIEGRVAGGTFRTIQTFTGIAATVVAGNVDFTAFDEVRARVTNTGAGATTTFEFQTRDRVVTG